MRSRIVWTSILIVIGTIISKILGFLREIIFAHQFGASAISDAFFLTNSIPNICFSALAISISTSFIPVYMGITEEKQRSEFTSNLLNICLILSILVCGLINLFPAQILRFFVSTISDELMKYAIPMLQVVSISIAPMIVGRIFQSYSQSNNQFISTAILGIVTNLVIIISYLLASKEHFVILSIGVVSAQVVAMFMFLYGSFSSGFKYYLRAKCNDSLLKMMVGLTFPLMAARFAEDASVLVDRNLAAGLGTGIISVLSYAALLANAISSMVTNSITTSTFPVISRLVAEEKLEAFWGVFLKYLNVLIYLFVPISVYMILFSDDLVVCILQHGALQPEVADKIGECMVLYAVGILPLGIQDYFVRGFYAFRSTRKPVSIVVFSLICNIVFSIIGSRVFGYTGIVAATSISYFIACILLIFVFQWEYGFSVTRSIYREFFASSLISCIAGILVFILLYLIGKIEFVYYRIFFESVIFWVIYVGVLLFVDNSLSQRIRSYLKFKT